MSHSADAHAYVHVDHPISPATNLDTASSTGTEENNGGGGAGGREGHMQMCE